MAEENQVSPISEAHVAKAPPATPNPVAEGVKTLKLNPVIRKPAAGATQSALRPGLKLPSKPAFAPGLKLPPKPGLPGATQSALRPGLKLPPKPVIRKSGETVAAAPLPKPVAVDAQGVGKLPTVEAKAVPRDENAPAAVDVPKPIETLKTVTQKLKGITQPIPAQAILHKTGIISDAAMSDSQKQAAKSKTARISLSDAMGVAPVKNESAPMKTIRIKRPIDIPGATRPLAAQPPAAVPAAVDAEVPPMPGEKADPKTARLPSAAAAETTAATPPSASITQRKTLKITRPGAAGVKPAGKFGVKRPGVKPGATAAAPAPDNAKTAGDGDGAIADVADIPDIPDVSAAKTPPVSEAPAAADVPAWATTLGLTVGIAASVAAAALVWFLYKDFQLPLYCGGCM